VARAIQRQDGVAEEDPGVHKRANANSAERPVGERHDHLREFGGFVE